MPGPSLGTNLSGLVDWSTAFPFVNQFQMTRPWYTQGGGVFDTGDADLLDLDAAGWVRDFTRDGSTPPFEQVCTIFNTNGLYQRTGTYILDWDGSGDGGYLRLVERHDRLARGKPAGPADRHPGRDGDHDPRDRSGQYRRLHPRHAPLSRRRYRADQRGRNLQPGLSGPDRGFPRSALHGLDGHEQLDRRRDRRHPSGRTPRG